MAKRVPQSINICNKSGAGSTAPNSNSQEPASLFLLLARAHASHSTKSLHDAKLRRVPIAPFKLKFSALININDIRCR